MMSKTYDCDSMLCKCYVHQDCVKGGPSVRTRLSASLDIGNEPSSCRTSAVLLLVLTPATVGVGDNCAILDFSQRHLTGHSWTYLRNLDVEKKILQIKFLSKPCYGICSHDSKMV